MHQRQSACHKVVGEEVKAGRVMRSISIISHQLGPILVMSSLRLQSRVWNCICSLVLQEAEFFLHNNDTLMLEPMVFENLSNQASALSCSIISGASTAQLVTAKARRFGANYGSLGQMWWVLPQTRETWIFDQMLESRNSLKWMPELLIWSCSVMKRNFVLVIWLSYPWHETRDSRWANVGSQNLPKPPLEVILFGGWRDGAGTHEQKVWLL